MLLITTLRNFGNGSGLMGLGVSRAHRGQSDCKTNHDDFQATESNCLLLFGRRECSIERRCSGTSGWSIAVTLRHEPWSHHAAQVMCQTTTDSNQEMFKRLVCRFPHPTVQILTHICQRPTTSERVSQYVSK